MRFCTIQETWWGVIKKGAWRKSFDFFCILYSVCSVISVVIKYFFHHRDHRAHRVKKQKSVQANYISLCTIFNHTQFGVIVSDQFPDVLCAQFSTGVLVFFTAAWKIFHVNFRAEGQMNGPSFRHAGFS